VATASGTAAAEAEEEAVLTLPSLSTERRKEFS